MRIWGRRREAEDELHGVDLRNIKLLRSRNWWPQISGVAIVLGSAITQNPTIGVIGALGGLLMLSYQSHSVTLIAEPYPAE